MRSRRVTGVVLAAGRSRRLGSPKQLLPYGGTTLLDATLEVARRCGFDQLIVTLGGALEQVLAEVNLGGVEAVIARDFGAGCSASLRAAIAHVDADADGIVLLLGDQPGIHPDDVLRVVASCGEAELAVCRYSDGVGHPFWLGRSLFEELERLRGDKAVWKLVDRARAGGSLVEVPVGGAIPLDVDTWADYERLLASVAP
ncbi:MAG: NTP transferase domain-containing protein [Mycobacterium sp.]